MILLFNIYGPSTDLVIGNLDYGRKLKANELIRIKENMMEKYLNGYPLHPSANANHTEIGST